MYAMIFWVKKASQVVRILPIATLAGGHQFAGCQNEDWKSQLKQNRLRNSQQFETQVVHKQLAGDCQRMLCRHDVLKRR